MKDDKLYNFIKSEKYAVISSVNRAGQPESALVAFSETEKLELIFATSKNSRKVKNILLNPNISIVIGFGDERLTSLQYEGVARVLNLANAGEYADTHYTKHPISLQHKDEPGECFIVINPTWVRYTNYSTLPVEVLEDHFDAY